MQEQIDELQLRCENLESVILDLMEILIQNKESGKDYGEYVGGDTQDLKETFEKLIKE